MTETWAGMDVQPAVTACCRTQRISSNCRYSISDGTQVKQLMYNRPGQYDDQLLYQQTTLSSTGKPLQKVQTDWMLGDYNSPIVSGTAITDQLGQIATTLYSYDNYANGAVCTNINGAQSKTNQLSSITQRDYGGTTGPVLRYTYIGYVADLNFCHNHIFNLPSYVAVEDGQGHIYSSTAYSYDQGALASTPGAVGYDNPGTTLRGNLTQVTRRDENNPSSPGIIENRSYDETGNLISDSGSCCADEDHFFARHSICIPCKDHARRHRPTRVHSADDGVILL